MDERILAALKNHSKQYLQMALKRDKQAAFENPDGYGKRTGDCQDTVEMFLMVNQEQIQDIAYQADGCLNTHACANTVACFAQGKTIGEAWDISAEQVIQYLETLPEWEHHCAELAVGAFYRALVDYQNMRKAPWKRQYRRKF